jgi:hypothetical protein
LLAVACGVGLTGCAKFQTARECGSFVAAINDWKGQAPKPVASAPRENPATPAAAASESRSLALRYEDLARRIDSLHLGSADLLPPAQRYQRLAREAAGALRDVADAVEKDDQSAARARRIEFEDLASGEAALVGEINRICR